MKRFETRDIILMAVFGALWGAVEMSLGGLLHLLQVPLRGAFLAAFGIGIALVGYGIARKPWFIMGMTVICCVLKLFSIGGFLLSPLLSIIIEGGIAEALMRVQTTTRRSFIITEFIVVLYSSVHYFLVQGLLFGKGIYKLYLKMLGEVSSFLHIPLSMVFALIAIILGFKVVLGILSGYVVWDLQRELHKRLPYLYLSREKD